MIASMESVDDIFWSTDGRTLGFTGFKNGISQVWTIQPGNMTPFQVTDIKNNGIVPF